MTLGTLDRTPPPIFRQGPSALTKLVLCSAAAVFLMAADARYTLVRPLRATIATVLLPAQQALRMPLRGAAETAEYARGLAQARRDEGQARLKSAQMAERAARGEQLAAENARLRALLGVREALVVKSIGAEVLYEATDPYSRKVFIDRGATHGVKLGAPVVGEAGVLGQVTELYPLSSLVTLVIDKDAAIPVLDPRSQHRAVAYGGVDGGMELRFVSPTADLKEGDALETSGFDGIYPPGLSVGRIARVERRADGFSRILVTPSGSIDGVRHVLVLEPVGLQLPPMPASAALASAPAAPARKGANKASAAAPAPAQGASR